MTNNENKRGAYVLVKNVDEIFVNGMSFKVPTDSVVKLTALTKNVEVTKVLKDSDLLRFYLR